jgi:hypothetical protein
MYWKLCDDPFSDWEEPTVDVVPPFESVEFSNAHNSNGAVVCNPCMRSFGK